MKTFASAFALATALSIGPALAAGAGQEARQEAGGTGQEAGQQVGGTGGTAATGVQPGDSAQQAMGEDMTKDPEVVRQVEERLQQEGYEVGQVDETWDDQSREALRKFQEERGLDATGDIEEQTLSALGVDDIGQQQAETPEVGPIQTPPGVDTGTAGDAGQAAPGATGGTAGEAGQAPGERTQ